MKKSLPYNLDRSIPRARSKGVFGDGTPSDSIRLTLVFVEVHDREFVHIDIEELYRPISTGGKQLILVDLGPGEVILGIVGVEPSEVRSAMLRRRALMYYFSDEA